MKRFQVVGHSMTPTLHPGQEVVATDLREPQRGDIVVFQSPRRDGSWLIKRLIDNSGTVLSDNPEVGKDDSRSFGPVPLAGMYVVIDRLDQETFIEACDLLATEDEALDTVVTAHGLPPFWHRDPGLPTLVWLILEQQVSLESGVAMLRRLTEAAGELTAPALLSLGTGGMRAIGVTRQKAGYLIELAERSLTDLDLEALSAVEWRAARESLLSVRGIGPWTADAYLLSALRVPDMWPVGDRALQVGTGEVLGMSSIPDEDELEILGRPWRPVRAVAARLIWHAYLSRRGRVEPIDPTSSPSA